MRRVEEGEECRRAAVLQKDTMSIAVADFGVFAQGELGGGQVKISCGTAREPFFLENVGTVLGPNIRWLHSPGG